MAVGPSASSGTTVAVGTSTGLGSARPPPLGDHRRFGEEAEIGELFRRMQDFGRLDGGTGKLVAVRRSSRPLDSARGPQEVWRRG